VTRAPRPGWLSMCRVPPSTSNAPIPSTSGVLSAMVMVGDPDGVAEQATRLRPRRHRGPAMTLPDVHDLEVVALAGLTLGPVSPRSRSEDLLPRLSSDRRA
jgi:hypothetical protein